jgi:hypothetical protein
VKFLIHSMQKPTLTQSSSVCILLAYDRVGCGAGVVHYLGCPPAFSRRAWRTRIMSEQVEVRGFLKGLAAEEALTRAWYSGP